MSRSSLALHVLRYFPLPFPTAIQKQPKLKRLYASSSQQKSTVHRGNAFEERSLKILQQTMSMSLKRVGGKEDGGIDLMGWWWLPDPSNVSSNSESNSNLETQSKYLGTPNDDVLARRRIRVIGQCKAEKKKMGPGYVRELEGVLFRYMTMSSSSSSSRPLYLSSPFSSSSNELSALTPSDREDGEEKAGQSHIPMVALLVSESPFTKSALLRAHSSPIPFFLLYLPPLEDAPPPPTTPGEFSQTRNINNSGPMDDTTDLDIIINTKTNTTPNPLPNGTLGAAVCNPALSGARGLLKGHLEVRWERSVIGDQQHGRPALWWKNERLQSLTPNMCAAADEDLPVFSVSTSAAAATTTTPAHKSTK